MDPIDILELPNLMEVPCPIVITLKSALQTPALKTANIIWDKIIDNAVFIAIKRNCNIIANHFVQNVQNFNVYSNTQLQFEKIIYAVFYVNNILSTKKNIIDICDETLDQAAGSNSNKWFNERSIRITASSAHPVKT